MPLPIAVLQGLEAIEVIGVAIGLTDLGLNLAPSSSGAHGIANDRPYVEIQRFDVTPTKAVVSDRIRASGMLRVGLGHLLDRWLGAWEPAELTFPSDRATVKITVRSSGGIQASKSESVRSHPATPTSRDFQLLGGHNLSFEGSGAGGYVFEELTTGEDYPVRNFVSRKICDEGSPVVDVPFEFTIQGREAGREDVWVEAEVTGYQAAFGDDPQVTVKQESERKQVEIAAPFSVERDLSPQHLTHGNRVDASIRLTNLAFEEELHWYAAWIGDSVVDGRSIPPRKKGGNSDLIHSVALGHEDPRDGAVESHPCQPGQQVWMSPAFVIERWAVGEMKVRLEDGTFWKDWWRGAPLPVRCVRDCSSTTGVVTSPSGGRFRHSGGELEWVPDGELHSTGGLSFPTASPAGASGESDAESDANGDGEPAAPSEEQEPDPPEPVDRSEGGKRVSWRMVPRFGGAPADASATLSGDRSGTQVALRVDESGRISGPEWPFDAAETATLTLTAAGFRAMTVAEVTAGEELDLSMVPDPVSLTGRVDFGGGPSVPTSVVAMAGEEIPWPKLASSPVGANGAFRLSGLRPDTSYTVTALPSLGGSVWEPIGLDVRTSVEDSEVVIEMAAPDEAAPGAPISLEGTLEGPLASATLVVLDAGDGHELARVPVAASSTWQAAVEPGRVVRLRVESDGRSTEPSPPLRVSADIAPIPLVVGPDDLSGSPRSSAFLPPPGPLRKALIVAAILILAAGALLIAWAVSWGDDTPESASDVTSATDEAQPEVDDEDSSSQDESTTTTVTPNDPGPAADADGNASDQGSGSAGNQPGTPAPPPSTPPPAPPPPSQAVADGVTITPPSAAPGTTVAVTGGGWEGEEAVQISFAGNTQTVAVGPDGTFAAQVSIPADIPPGGHPLDVSGLVTGRVVELEVIVLAS